MNSAQNPAAGLPDRAASAAPAPNPAVADPSTAFAVLGAISVAHLMNCLLYTSRCV